MWASLRTRPDKSRVFWKQNASRSHDTEAMTEPSRSAGYHIVTMFYPVVDFHAKDWGKNNDSPIDSWVKYVRKYVYSVIGNIVCSENIKRVCRCGLMSWISDNLFYYFRGKIYLKI